MRARKTIAPDGFGTARARPPASPLNRFNIVRTELDNPPIYVSRLREGVNGILSRFAKSLMRDAARAAPLLDYAANRCCFLFAQEQKLV